MSTESWFVYDPYNNDTVEFDAEGHAVDHAGDLIDGYLDDGSWDEAVEQIIVGKVTHRIVKDVIGVRADMTPEAWEELTGGLNNDADEWWLYRVAAVAQRGETT